jgi:hypothetical protein
VKALVEAFTMEYLEPDGFFFLRMVSVNVSDFVVQEIIEQLWSCYVMRYGENDAKRAEEYFRRFRRDISPSSSIMSTRSRLLDVSYEQSGANDSKRKYLKQNSDIGTELLRSTNVSVQNLSSMLEHKEQV